MKLERKGKTKKGFINTLEAVVASSMLLVFVINILPGLTEPEEIHKFTAVRISEILRTYDESVRNYALEGDMDSIKDLIRTHLPITYSTGVGISWLNVTEGSISTSGTHTANFSANKSIVQEEVLKLWILDADSPGVSVNGNYIWGNDSTMQNEYREFRLNLYDRDGSNNFTVNVSGLSHFEYEIDQYMYVNTSIASKNVMSVSYIVAGNNTKFDPREVTVYVWIS